MVAWIAAAELSTPWVVRQASRAGAAHEHLLLVWHLIASRGAIAAILFFVVLATALRSERFVAAQIGSATPAALGAVRIVVCAILLANSLWEDLASTALLPREMIQPMGVMSLVRRLPGFDAFSGDPGALALFQASTALLLTLALVGWRTRWVLPAAAVGYLVMGGILREYTKFFHTGIVPLLVLFVLAMTPCADALSLDRRRRLRHGKPVPPARLPQSRYAWARYACWTVVALTYFFAGANKIRTGGADWFSTASFKRILLQDTLDPMQFDWKLSLRLIDAPDALFVAMAVTAVAIELLYVTVLFSRTARLVVPPLAALMHVGIWFLQNVLFFDLILIQLVFVDWDRIAARMRGRGRRHGIERDLTSEAGIGSPEVAAQSRWRRRILALAGLLLVCWVAVVEQYPLSAFQMYSGASRGTTVSYLRVDAHYASGRTERAPIERALPVFKDGRYREPLRGCFFVARRAICDALLRTFLESPPVDGPGSDAVERIEVQLWQWDFERDAEDPARGRLLGRYLFPE